MNRQVLQSGATYNDAAIAGMVGDGRVHSRVYTDPGIFEIEIERIFSAAWIYVGHDSEVPNPGDYQMRSIGRTPVLLVRGVDNAVRVLVTAAAIAVRRYARPNRATPGISSAGTTAGPTTAPAHWPR